MAGKAAMALIKSRAPQLKISKHDGFVAKTILTSGAANYAPYERTWRGLPVVGGDFVVVTDDEGHVLGHLGRADQQGQARPRRPPACSRAARRASRGSRSTRSAAPRPHVSSCGRARPRTSPGRPGSAAATTDTPSIQSVYVDARNGQVPLSKEHVAEGTGNGNWEGAVTIPTSGSGSSFSMTNSNAIHHQVPERLGQRHVHRN